ELEMRVAQRTLELDETTHALSKSETRLALALEASQLGLWDWDLVSDQVHHSQLRELFGLDSQSVAVLADRKPRLHPDDLPTLRRALVEHMKGRSDGYAVEYRIRHEDGRWLWIEDRGRAVERAADGTVLRMIGTRRDITARKLREEEQRLASTVFEAASEGIIILSEQYRILAINQAFTQVTGHRREEVLGSNVLRLIGSEEARQQYQRIRLELEQQGSWQGELLE